MTAVSMFEAKTNLSKYVASVVAGEEPYIVILKNGLPVARIVPYEEETSHRLGLAEGSLPYLPDTDAFNRLSLESVFEGNGGLL